MALSLLKNFSVTASKCGRSTFGRRVNILPSPFRSFSAAKDSHSKPVATQQHGAHGHGNAPAKTSSHKDVAHTKEHEHLFPFEDGDYVPPTETHAVGDEREELDFGPFESTVLKGGFGTMEKPVEVPSRYGSRIVGCTGSATEEHDLLWHTLKLGKDLMCIECNQVFRLTTIPGFEEMAHGHGHHEHEEHEFHGHRDGDGFRFMHPPKTQAQLAKEKAERDEELKKDPKATPKKEKATGVDYHHVEQSNEEEGRLSAKAPIFQDKRPQIHKDRK
eukprot:TRINITY_DN176_c0_g1_i1.p1 TRINITY_DN176_c0_g1~~TRINITY_DN176_c0_g1_i1.p1  ORF type:complete len:274 (+),score=65.71 TRINITY_DN176_c0_g1_i1:56-877(+)